VIPVHDAELFLKHCLDSILSDGTNNSPFEVIAVDDASNDGSWTILENYAESCEKLRLIRFEENRGVSAARNAGVAAARGDYVMFCDPDDAYVPGAVDCIVSIVREREPDIVLFQYALCRGQQTSIRFEPDYSQSIFDMRNSVSAVAGFLKLFSILWTWNGAFHRRLFSKLKFDERLWPSEDVLWGVQATCQCETAVVSDAVLYKYNQRPGSCLHRVFFSRVRSEILGIGEFAKAAKAWPFFEQVTGDVFDRLNFRAFGRPVKILQRLPRREREAAWELLFETYPEAFSGLVPKRRRRLYAAAFRRKSRFLVVAAISTPLRMKSAILGPLFNIGIRKRIITSMRRLRKRLSHS
jgi:glycosyltransferase involved in cell wall biosynthesis